MIDLSRLRAQLLISGLQQKDPSLYQVIDQLIKLNSELLLTISKLVNTNISPLKLTAKPLLATPEIGLLEFTDDGTTANLYITVRIAGIVTRVLIA